VEISQDRLALSVTELSKSINLSIPTLYRAINSGELRSFLVGRRRLISREAAQSFIHALEARGSKVA
jgi:excisionase family DNA binding protein